MSTIIKFKDIHGYYPNNEFYTREKEFIENQCKELGLKYNRVPYNTKTHPRQNGMSIDFINLMKESIKINIFPFIYMEDDSAVFVNPPEEFYIPDNILAIIWSGSTYECGGMKAPIRLEEYDDFYYRAYNVLAPGVIIVPNAESAQTLADISTMALEKGEFTDLFLAMESNNHVILTPKDSPYFYQPNYNEHVTKFLWKDNLDKYLYPCQQ
jgi:hypothetical protein